MKKLISLTTKLFFRAKTVCSVNYSDIERLVDAICRLLRNDKEATVDDVQKMMVEWTQYPDDPIFELNFKKLELPQAKAKYALQEIHFEMVGGQHSSSGAISNRIEVEHIMPQKISPGSTWEEFIINKKGKTTPLEIDEYHKEFVNKLGNMTLLNKTRNQSLSNDSFEKKKEMYAKDSLEITKRLADVPEWDDSTIMTRQGQFLTFAKKIWDVKLV